MKRRAFLSSGVVGVGLLAGCSAESGFDRQTTFDTTAGTRTDSTTATATTSQAQRDTPNTIFVDTDGSIEASGTKDDPIGSIQTALLQATPGDTIQVRSGVYQERIEPPQGGQPENPITITGPPDAILKSDPQTYNVVLIRHSHIHITGLTIDGLEDPDASDDVDSYSRAQLVQTRPPKDTDEYLTDLVVTPHRIGNSQKSLISLERTRNAEVGRFEVIGPAGAKYLYSDRQGHNGEIVYVGTAFDNLGSDWHPWEDLDESGNIRVHHIDNSAGHPHAELVDVKGGASNVTIEYCTDAGGAAQYILAGHPPTSEAAVHLGGNQSILRWNRIHNSQGQVVEVGGWGPAHPERYEENKGDPLPEGARDTGQQNSIYHNKFREYGGLAIQYPVIYPDDGEPYIAEEYGPDEQTHICGNVIDGPTHGTPDNGCPDELPDTNEIGHLGGDSPWA